jgi:hypothetical protein
VLLRVADQHKVKFILNGLNASGESILPKAWSQGHFDWKYIKAVQKRFGTRKLKTFPHFGVASLVYHFYLKRISMVRILEYLPYAKEEAKRLITEQMGWRDYGRKHCESNYTRIYQEYILPRKFGIDKRKAHLSSLIMAGQITREAALAELAKPLAVSRQSLEEDLFYLTNKFGISRAEFETILAAPPRSMRDFPSLTESWYFVAGRRLHKLLSVHA